MALIKCRECGSDISSEAKTCPHCGCPSKEKKTLPKFHELPIVSNFLKSPGVFLKRTAILIAIIVVSITAINIAVSNLWERYFDVQFIEKHTQWAGGREWYCYDFELTNKSSKAFYITDAKVKFEDARNGNIYIVEVSGGVGGHIDPHDTETIHLLSCYITRDVISDTSPIKNVEIVGLKWERIKSNLY